MKTTTKKNGAKRHLAGILAAIAMMSAVVPTAANCMSASAMENPIDVAGNIDNQDWGNDDKAKMNKEIFKLIEMAGKKGLEKALDMLLAKIPLANELGLKKQIMNLLTASTEKEITNNQLAEKIDQLEETMMKAFDDQTKQLIRSMRDAFTEGTYKSDMQNLTDTASILKTLRGSDKTAENLTREEMLVKLAMVAGSKSKWELNGSLVKQHRIVTSDLMGRNYKDNRDIFNILYDTNKLDYAFSGECLDAINPFIVSMITDYLEYSMLLLASLNAQEQILSEDFDASQIHDAQIKKQYDAFDNDLSSIQDMAITILRSVYGSEAFAETGIELNTTKKEEAENYDSVLAHYELFQKKNRFVHIASGKFMSRTLLTTDGDHLINNSKSKSIDYGEAQLEKTTKADFEKRITGQKDNGGMSNCFSVKEMKAIAEHLKQVITEKKKTDPKYNGWTYLKEIGFDVADVWKVYGGSGRYIPIGSGYAEKNYSWSMSTNTWNAMIDVIDMETGEIKSVQWKEMHNNTGLFDLINGNQAWFTGCSYTFLRQETNPNWDFNDLGNGTYQLDQDLKINGTIRVAFNQEVTFDLNGYTIDRGLTQEAAHGEIFTLERGAKLTIIDTSKDKTGKLTGGYDGNGGAIYVPKEAELTVDGITITGNSAKKGGAIYTEGKLVVHDCTISNNTAADGGAIYVTGTGTCKVTGKTTFEQNKTTTNGGGAITNYGSELYVEGVTFKNNSSKGRGGAIFTKNNLELKDSYFEKNHSDFDGGAICNDGKTVEIYNTTFSNNDATGDGGTIMSQAGSTTKVYDSKFNDNKAVDGGACYLKGTNEFHNTEFSGNQATNKGGAVNIGKGSVKFYTCTFKKNVCSKGSTLRFANGAKYDFLDGCVNDGTIY
jgi:predicted outer membrane repeat protein